MEVALEEVVLDRLEVVEERLSSPVMEVVSREERLLFSTVVELPAVWDARFSGGWTVDSRFSLPSGAWERREGGSFSMATSSAALEMRWSSRVIEHCAAASSCRRKCNSLGCVCCLTGGEKKSSALGSHCGRA